MKSFDEFITEANVKSLAQVNKHIQKNFHPDLQLVRGNGYYYFTSSDNDESGKMLHAIQQAEDSSVYIYSIKATDLKYWENTVKAVLSDMYNYGDYKDKYTSKYKNWDIVDDED